jgi:hypothetical protein
MKKFFLFAAAALMSVAASAEISIEVCTLDSTKLAELNGGPIATKTYTEATIPAGTVLLDGNDMKVTVPFDQTFQWVGAAQPNGAHKKIGFGNLNTEISMVEGIQGKDNPKDGDGQNPCNTLLAPTQGAAFAINAKVDGWIVITLLYSTDGLAGDAHLFGELILRHIAGSASSFEFEILHTTAPSCR